MRQAEGLQDNSRGTACRQAGNGLGPRAPRNHLRPAGARGVESVFLAPVGRKKTFPGQVPGARRAMDSQAFSLQERSCNRDNRLVSRSHSGTRPPRPCVAGERGRWKTQASFANLPFLPHKAAGDASHNVTGRVLPAGPPRLRRRPDVDWRRWIPTAAFPG